MVLWLKWVVRYVAGLGCTTLLKGGAGGRRQLEVEEEGGTMQSLSAWRHLGGRGHHHGYDKGSTGAEARGGM